MDDGDVRMNKKAEFGWGGFVIFIAFILLAIGFVTLIIYQNEFHDSDCLKPYAEKYCKDNNMNLSLSGTNSFNCKLRLNGRETSEYTPNIKYLDSEYLNCKIKDKKTLDGFWGAVK